MTWLNRVLFSGRLTTLLVKSTCRGPFLVAVYGVLILCTDVRIITLCADVLSSDMDR